MKQQGKIRQILLDNFEFYLAKAKKSEQEPLEADISSNILSNGKKRKRKIKSKKIIRIRSVEICNVLKVLACRTPLLGEHTYVCSDCGLIKTIPHSCKSRFCSVCGYIATDNWIKKRFHFLLDCPYQHIVVTVPASYRWIIKLNQPLVLGFFLRSATSAIKEWAKDRGFQVGMVTFYHSFGGRLQFHPHFHILVTSGGITNNGQCKALYSNFPGHVLVEKFKAKFISGLKDMFRRGKLKTKAPLSRVLYQIDHPYDNHWQFYTQRLTRSSKETMKYCVRYAKKMIISELRIYSYNGRTVTYECYGKDKKGKKSIYPQTDDVLVFIEKILKLIPEKYFNLIRYYGFYSNNQYVKKTYKLALKYFQPLDTKGEVDCWRHRQWRRDRKDPLTCPYCNKEMYLRSVSYPPQNYYLMYNWDKILAANNETFQQRLIICNPYSQNRFN